MTNQTVARRYAQALYEEAASAQNVERIDEDMEAIRETLEASRDLVLFFESPIIAREKKQDVVQTLFGERLHPTTMNFLRLLIEKKREEVLPEVARAYRALRDAQRGVVEARARVAFPLTDAEQAQLAQALEALSGTRIRLTVRQDPALVGGLVVRIGDTVYDGSVRNQLASLRERMETGTFAGNGVG